MIRARRIARLVPLSIAVSGRRRNAVFGALDPILRRTARHDIIETELGSLVLDPEHPPERLLSYLFYNVLRYYSASELGQYIRRVALPGSTFIDVGANLGMYTLVARACGLNTVAIEPEPAHSAFLLRNEQTFGTVLPIALSDAAGTLPLFYEASNPGATSLVPSAGFARSSALVPVQTFSETVAQLGLAGSKTIRLVKIDVEGLEANVVKGMAAYLDSGPRPDIWCEVRGDRSGRNGGSFRDVCRELSRFGYHPSELRGGQETLFNDKELAARSVFDLLFTCTT